jgi:putative membrane protein
MTDASPPDLGLAERDAYVRALDRPHARLFWLYLAQSLVSGPLFPVVFLVLYFRFHTLAYRLDDEGVSVSWGYFFRQETFLQYRKIQDIHVRRGLVERWLGLATVEVQTASGSSAAEVTLEGLEDHDAVRDFLYRHMRGLEPEEKASEAKVATAEAEALALLREVKAELVATREALVAARAGRPPEAPRAEGGP